MLFLIWTSVSVNVNSADNSNELTWGLIAIGAPGAWNYTLGLKEIVVAVIDSGLDYRHPEFAGRVWNNTDEILNGIDDDGNGYIDDIRGWNFYDGTNDPFDALPSSHGTHVSGTIAAALDGVGVAGVAPNVTIMPLKVFGTDDNGGAVGLSDAIRYAIDNGANIISMSLGGLGFTTEERKAIEDAWDAGLVLVAANGNEAGPVGFPAAFDEVIAVSAVDENLKLADFSNTGDPTEIAAPGVGVNSTVRQGSGQWTKFSVNGTSYEANWMEFAPNADPAVIGEMEYIGLGRSEDVAGRNLTGKIALIQRGEIYFRDKVGNASAVGAIGAVIFNNQPGNFLGTLGEPGEIPAVSISKSDGQFLLDQLNQNMTLNATLVSKPANYSMLSGTSMATPHVSGAAALVWSLNTSLSNIEVRRILARSTTDLGTKGRDKSYGFGLLNVEKAMEVTLDSSLPILDYNLSTSWNNDTNKITAWVNFTSTDDVGIWSVTIDVLDVNGSLVANKVYMNNDRDNNYKTRVFFKGLDSTRGNLTFVLNVEDLRGHRVSAIVDTITYNTTQTLVSSGSTKTSEPVTSSSSTTTTNISGSVETSPTTSNVTPIDFEMIVSGLIIMVVTVRRSRKRR